MVLRYAFLTLLFNTCMTEEVDAEKHDIEVTAADTLELEDDLVGVGQPLLRSKFLFPDSSRKVAGSLSTLST